MIMKKADSLAYMPYNIILFQTLKYGGEPVSVMVGGGGTNSNLDLKGVRGRLQIGKERI